MKCGRESQAKEGFVYLADADAKACNVAGVSCNVARVSCNVARVS